MKLGVVAAADLCGTMVPDFCITTAAVSAPSGGAMSLAPGSALLLIDVPVGVDEPHWSSGSIPDAEQCAAA
jgi:hypothetical protein